MDAVMVVCTCRRPVSYLMAEASWKRRVIGDLAWALGVVPVKRAQDEAKAGTGMIQLSKTSTTITTDVGENEMQLLIAVVGTRTKFSQELEAGDKIRPPGTAFALKVTSIESDTKMMVDGLGMPAEFPQRMFDVNNKVTFEVMKHTPLTTVFEKVLDRLAGGGALGIFPEGGSHDRTDLLPLKIGISLISYSTLEKYGLVVPIVPVGLSYFRSHRWRGRAVVEYGRPILMDPASLEDFQAGGMHRRNVCTALLEEVETAMRSVIVTAPDYETLELIHTARRLYQRNKGPMEIGEKQELSRRFVEGYKRLITLAGKNPDPAWVDMQTRIVEYRNELKDLGLKDYQVPALAEEHLDDNLAIEKVDGDNVLRFFQLFYNVVHKLILIGLCTIPVLCLNLPVGVMAGLYAERRRKTALSKSKVKVKGFDVMLTEKVVFCLVMVPTLWIVYGMLLYFCTNLDGPTVALIMMFLPIISFIGINVTESGFIEWHDLRPNLMRLMPSSRKRLAALPAKRKQLQDDLRGFIRTIGPNLGEIYFGKDVDWTKIQERPKVDDVKKTK
jgi:glycerol-3-phosphate O-acyltransferase / dihydroxyacetone phosphate acyltransferase